MFKSPCVFPFVLVSFLSWSLSATVQAQSYYEMMSGIIQEGQSAESQVWDAYHRSVREEQNLYQRAMQDPQVVARYRQFLASGGQASLADYAVYYVRSGGGNSQIFNHNLRRQTALNARDRNAVLGTYGAINDINRRTHEERGRSGDYRNRLLGDELAGTATHHNQWGSFQVPTTLSYGTWAADDQGNLFTVDRSGQYYLYTDWGWQPLHARGR